MQNRNDVTAYHQKLRRLAVEDPLLASDEFLAILDSDPAALEGILQLVSSPGEGRLRQIIANAVRSLPAKERLVPFLIRWRDVETDEFAFRAINGALVDLDLSSYTPVDRSAPLVPPEIVEGYRYAADRLSHKLRNALSNPEARILRLRSAVNALTDDAQKGRLLSLLGELNDDLQRVGRVIGSVESDPSYFQIRPIQLSDWLALMNKKYGSQYSPIKLTIKSDLDSSVVTLASDYLFETVFWNLWVNAQEAVGEVCSITVVITEEAEVLKVVLIDNGDGFPPELENVIFRQMFSNKSPERGRGLLEVQDAVERLHGRVGLVEVGPREYRVRIIIPIVRQ